MDSPKFQFEPVIAVMERSCRGAAAPRAISVELLHADRAGRQPSSAPSPMPRGLGILGSTQYAIRSAGRPGVSARVRPSRGSIPRRARMLASRRAAARPSSGSLSLRLRKFAASAASNCSASLRRAEKKSFAAVQIFLALTFNACILRVRTRSELGPKGERGSPVEEIEIN